MADSQIVPGTATSISTQGNFQVAPNEEDLRLGVTVAGVTGTALLAAIIPEPSGGMIVPEIAIRKFLQLQTAITDLTEERCYETRLPIKKFLTVKDIPQTLLVQSGGGVVQRGAPILHPKLLFKCYGPNLSDANELYQALCSVLHEKENLDILPPPNRIVESYCSVPGHPLLDVQTDWEYFFATFSLIMTNQI